MTRGGMGIDRLMSGNDGLGRGGDERWIGAPCGFLALWIPAFAGMTGWCAGVTRDGLGPLWVPGAVDSRLRGNDGLVRGGDGLVRGNDGLVCGIDVSAGGGTGCVG